MVIKKMEGKIGTIKAGDLSHKKSIMMIVSILAVTVFIGTAVQPALSAPSQNTDSQPVANEKEYFPCDCEQTTTEGAGCQRCVEAVFHAVKYMRAYVKETFKGKGVYFLWTADVAIVVVEGLILGLKDSGFTIDIDYNELKSTVDFWVGKLWGPQMFFITRFMARLGAISIGITWYLLSFCVDS
jgi:hypothetical protein